MILRKISRAVLLSIGTLLMSSCGSNLAAVSGVVTLDGEILDHGNVSFHQPGMARGVGRIQADGSYSVMTGTDEGIEPGSYQVTVVALASLPQQDGFGEPVRKLTTPLKYKSTDTSGLSVEVESGSNEYNIALVSD